MGLTVKRKALLQACVLVMTSIGLVACSDEAMESSNSRAEIVVGAKHLQLTQQDIPVYYTTSGTVTSDHRVSISTRLSGYIRDIAVREGDKVKSGQVLLHIDSVHAKQALIQASADLANAKAEMNRYASLLKEGAVTSQQMDKVALRYKVAQSQVKQAKNQLSYAKVLSPVSGVVVEKRMSQGDLASPGMPILTLEDPSSLLVETYVSEQYIGQIHEGNKVSIEITALKQRLEGVVRQVVQAADPVSHQFLVKISLPVSANIHPGMYAQTSFHTGDRKGLLLPRDAIFSQAGMQAVYVVDDAGITHYRLVRIGRDVHGMLEVLSGLHAGDRIVWDANSVLKTGMKVEQ